MGIISKINPVFKNVEKILSKISVDIETECWNWIGEIDKNGYGYFRIRNNSERKSFRSHRVIYDIFIGVKDLEKVIDHKCRNRKCCNPDHLQEIARSENVLLDNSLAPSAINKQKKECKHGHKFTIENTYISKFGRSCKACHAIVEKNRRLKQKGMRK